MCSEISNGANVVKMSAKKKPQFVQSQIVGKPKSKRAIKVGRAQALAATGVMSVALVLTGLSLTHLSHGIEVVTKAPSWEAWLMAVGIDLGFIVLELAQLVPMQDKTRIKIKNHIKYAIVGTLVGSALMNAFAFGMAAVGWLVIPAVLFGLAIPALIFAMTKVGAQMWLDR